MIGTIDIEVQAKNPNMPLWPLRAYVNSPSSLRVRNVPKKIGKWEITAVQVRVVYPDITDKTAQCVLTGGVWVGTVEGSTAVGSFKNGYTVLADGVDENGNPVTGYVLGRGDVEILKVDGTPISGDVSYFVTDEELAEGLSVKLDKADYHEGYIADADGNAISADGSMDVAGAPYWTLTDGTSAWTLEKATNRLWSWETTDEKYEIMQGDELTGHVTTGWSLKHYTKLAGVPIWVTQWTEFATDYVDTVSLEFPAHGFTAAKTTPVSRENAATRNYVDSQVSVKADVSALGDYIPYTVDKNGSKTAVTVGTRAISSSVGQCSFACGVSNTASNLNNVALGYSNVATGQDAVAIGSNNTVAGNASLAVGSTNNVLTAYSIALGQNNTLSSGSNTTAIGTMNTANGKYGVAMGGRANADDSGSFVWNGGDKANVVLFPSYYSHGKGTFNINPVSGAAGFYIGEESLTDILSAKADLSALDYKRDLNDLNIYADPMEGYTPIEVTVWHTSEISTLYVLNWDGSSWYYTNGDTSIQIYFDNYSNHYILTGSVQDMGGTRRSIGGQLDLTSPLWSVAFEAQYFYKIDVASVKAHIATKEYVDSRLSALEARIAALEGN